MGFQEVGERVEATHEISLGSRPLLGPGHSELFLSQNPLSPVPQNKRNPWSKRDHRKRQTSLASMPWPGGQHSRARLAAGGPTSPPVPARTGMPPIVPLRPLPSPPLPHWMCISSLHVLKALSHSGTSLDVTGLAEPHAVTTNKLWLYTVSREACGNPCVSMLVSLQERGVSL